MDRSTKLAPDSWFHKSVRNFCEDLRDLITGLSSLKLVQSSKLLRGIPYAEHSAASSSKCCQNVVGAPGVPLCDKKRNASETLCHKGRSGAEGGNRTHTRGEPHRILSPARLPVPPLRHVDGADCLASVTSAYGILSHRSIKKHRYRPPLTAHTWNLAKSLRPTPIAPLCR